MSILEQMVGLWGGTTKTWFEPGKLADESQTTAEFAPVFQGQFVRYTYEGAIQGKPLHGEALLAFNPVPLKFEMSWIDNFHMSQAIMFSVGEATVDGFSVTGSYDVGADQPAWAWRTDFALSSRDQLTVTAYNVHPAGDEAKAIETLYSRRNPNG